jgi:hypothetical protein
VNRVPLTAMAAKFPSPLPSIKAGDFDRLASSRRIFHTSHRSHRISGAPRGTRAPRWRGTIPGLPTFAGVPAAFCRPDQPGCGMGPGEGGGDRKHRSHQRGGGRTPAKRKQRLPFGTAWSRPCLISPVSRRLRCLSAAIVSGGGPKSARAESAAVSSESVSAGRGSKSALTPGRLNVVITGPAA